jgi:hypothetical protein
VPIPEKAQAVTVSQHQHVTFLRAPTDAPETSWLVAAIL